MSSSATSSSKSKSIFFSLPGTCLLTNTLIGAAIKCACFDCGTYTRNDNKVSVWIHQATKNVTIAAVGDIHPNAPAIKLAIGSVQEAPVPCHICNIPLLTRTDNMSVPIKMRTKPALNPRCNRKIFYISRRYKDHDTD